MAGQRGLWLAASTEDSAEKWLASIERGAQFTTVVTASEIQPKAAEFCLVSLSGNTVDYLGVSRAGPLIATDQKRIAVSRLTELNHVSLESIEKTLSPSLKSHFTLPAHGPSRISTGLWAAILAALRTAVPAAGDAIGELSKHVTELNLLRRRRSGGLEVFERDAVASAVQFWGGTDYRKKLLRTAAPEAAISPAPFLARLGGVPLREDAQIFHDASTFPGLQVARRDVVGAVELYNERGERLTILHCNRQPLEETLGVDLIYYNHVFDSFILVQYKRMTGSGKQGPVYRPAGDSNYESEMARMTKVQTFLAGIAPASSGSLEEYRLSHQPCYLKFCETKSKAALDEGMVAGMYVPLEVWAQFVASPQAKGERGGTLVSWRHRPRNLNNASFTNLLRSGWIGSAAGQSQALSDIISSVLAGKRMLIIAASSAGYSSPDFRRDEYGRFARNDDPLASA